MGAEEEKAKRLVEKYKRTPEQLAQDIKKMEQAKKDITRNSEQLDANLRKFHETLDPLMDPSTDQPLCWIRRPSQTEWEEMTPSELAQYKSPEDIPKELTEKYKDHQFTMMEKLIANPKHDAKWWKENTDLVFQEMFQLYLMDVYRKLGIMVGNF
jgi:hypothetical protein